MNKIALVLAVLTVASIDAGANRAARRHPGRGVADQPCSLKESVDLKRASRITGIAYSTLREWIARGDLPAYRVNGTRVRVYVEDLQNLFVPVKDVDPEDLFTIPATMRYLD